MDEMIRAHYELTQALVHVMADRIKNYVAIQQQDEKMIALGRLSAGLSHELNNPVSAIVRGSNVLLQHVQFYPENCKALIDAGVLNNELDYITIFLKEIKDKGAVTDARFNMLERADLEDRILQWLKDHNISDNSDVVDTFIDYAIKVSDLDSIKENIRKEVLPVIIGWMSGILFVERVANDTEVAAKQITSILNAVKTFTYMDKENEKQLEDIHTGIRNTLIIMSHKLKMSNIAVEESFDNNLPLMLLATGQMNQVWANLIDNAIDAMEVNGKGNLKITTKKEADCVKVIISDDGEGITPEGLVRIFDPFYTTKAIGKGTGLGLDVVKNIVSQHMGTVMVKSTPGKTDFIIDFPIKIKEQTNA